MFLFFWFTGYCRRFIPRYKALTNPIDAMNKYFEWSEDIEKDFRELKEEFAAGKIQSYPDFDSNEPFILTADWFALNIAGILSQKQGVELISCWGRKCNQ